jgi:flagellar hook-associated protein FlgK
MDIDQLRKINQLSHELRKHHMAESSNEAYDQAQQIVTITQKPSASAGQETVLVEAAPAADQLAARQFQIELDRIQKTVNEEMDVLRNALNQIISEVNSLRDELSKVQTAQPPKPKEKQAELKTEDKTPHARVGNFQPGDVDIQKMFYFGTKK